MGAGYFEARNFGRYRRVILPFVIQPLTLVIWIVGTCSLTWAQSIKPGGQSYYQPPFLPIQIGADSDGRVSVTAVAQVVTPVGVFGVGGGASYYRSDEHTYFVVRHRGQDRVYCVGVRGRLRLTTVGRSVVEIYAEQDRSNVYVVEVVASRGRFEVEFIPDQTASELARIRISNFVKSHVALLRDGSILFDEPVWDVTIRLEDLLSASVFESPNQGRVFPPAFGLTWRGKNIATWQNGKWIYLTQLRDETEIEARWFLYVLSRIAQGKAKELRVQALYETQSGEALAQYEDGSVRGLALHLAPFTIDALALGPNSTIAVTFKPPYCSQAIGNANPCAMWLAMKRQADAEKLIVALRRGMEN